MANQTKVKWLSRADMCERYANVHPNTISQWVRERVLPPPVAIGGMLLWNEAECDEADERSRAITAARRESKIEQRRKAGEASLRVRAERRAQEQADQRAAHAVPVDEPHETPAPAELAAVLTDAGPVPAPPAPAPRKRSHHKKRVPTTSEEPSG